MGFGNVRGIACITSAFATCHSVSSVGDSGEGSCKMAAKVIKDIMPAPRPHWVGNGFNVYPVFSNLAFTEHLSPFLMFDYAAPKEFGPTSKQRGVGKHPHR